MADTQPTPFTDIYDAFFGKLPMINILNGLVRILKTICTISLWMLSQILNFLAFLYIVLQPMRMDSSVLLPILLLRR